MVKRRWTRDELARAERLVRQGVPCREVAERFATSRNTLKTMLSRYRNGKLEATLQMLEHKDEMIRLAEAGHTPREIHVALGRTSTIQGTYTRLAYYGFDAEVLRDYREPA